jgi:hypothetical protein
MIGVWQSNNMSRRNSGREIVRLRRASGKIVRDQCGFDVGVIFGSAVEVVRAGKNGEDGTMNLGVLLLAELDRPKNRRT